MNQQFPQRRVQVLLGTTCNLNYLSSVVENLRIYLQASLLIAEFVMAYVDIPMASSPSENVSIAAHIDYPKCKLCTKSHSTQQRLQAYVYISIE
jgi:hypothetical protein